MSEAENLVAMAIACVAIGVTVGFLAFVVTAGLEQFAPAPSQPRETPWIWLAPSPVGGGCVVFGDQLGTCFTVEAP